MQLVTRRCLIRNWRAEDVDRVFDIYRRDEVARWLGSVPRALTDRAEAESMVRGWVQRNEAEAPFGRWAVEELSSGIVAGTALLVRLPGGDGEVEVGWHFHPDAWGRGLATESALALIEHGFASGLTEILAVVRPDNIASLAVCQRLGMTPLGRSRRWYDTELEVFRLRPDSGRNG